MKHIFSSDYNAAPWIKMPIAELVTPKPGRLCKGPSFWAVTPDECVLFFEDYSSPQSNTNRAIVERIRPGLEVRFIEMAFVPHRCEVFV
jgi:hypothetical protein